MDWDTVFKGASVVISVLALLIAYFRTRNQGVDQRIHDVEERTSRNESQVQVLKQKVEEMPNKDHLHRLEVTLVELAGDVKTISQGMKGQREILTRIENTVGMHQEHLMKGPNK